MITKMKPCNMNDGGAVDAYILSAQGFESATLDLTETDWFA